MIALQDRLLDAAVEMLAPGGTVVYCVCSLQREEARTASQPCWSATPGSNVGGSPLRRSAA
jgi:16S rRNA (cytosine967-C5)-methyltransferase